MTIQTEAGVAPEIILSEEDFASLDRLVGDLPARGAAGLLQQELDRAVIRPATDLPRDVVSLNRWIHYVDGRRSEARRVRLVLPHEANVDTGRISILSHVGAGLIGLREGETLTCTDPSGETLKLTVILVEDDDPCE